MVTAWRKIAEDSEPEKARFEMALSLSVDEPWTDLDNANTYTYPWAPGGDAFRFNVIPSVQQTIHSELVQSKPRPKFLTDGGTYEERERAKLANKWIDGLFYEAKVYDDVTPTCVMDALSFGMGIAKVFTEDERVTVRRVMPWEVFVDPVDGRARKPRNMFQVEIMDRDRAMALWPDKADEIEVSPACSSPWEPAHLDGADVVLVVEAWHLPSAKEAGDGRHVIAIGDGITVLDEEWTRDGFPFAIMRWIPRPIGWQGRGIPEQLMLLNQSINKTALQIDLAQDAAAPTWLTDRNSKVNKAKLTNLIGSVIEYTGRPPQFYPPATSHPSMYQWFERQVQRAYEVIGVSQLAAQSRIPRGMEGASGVALETYLDKGSARFYAAQTELESFCIQIAELACLEVEELAEEDTSYEVVYTRDGIVERVDWAKLKMSSPFVLKVFPTSLFPTTPAGKMKRLEDMMNSGIAQALGMTPETLQRLFDVPDLEAERLTAPRDVIDRMISKMLRDEDETIVPDPLFNLQLALQQGMLHYASGVADGMPEEKLGLLRQWCSAAVALINKGQEQAAPPAPPEPMPADALPSDAMPPEISTDLPLTQPPGVAPAMA